jgi:HSP20 family protein
MYNNFKNSRFLDSLDLMVQDFLQSGLNTAVEKTKDLTGPAVNIFEDDEKYQLDLSLPGIPKDRIDITIEDKILVIKGIPMDETDSSELKWLRKEWKPNFQFKRKFTLPENADVSKIEAKFDLGILKVSIFKMPSQEPKPSSKINIL